MCPTTVALTARLIGAPVTISYESTDRTDRRAMAEVVPNSRQPAPGRGSKPGERRGGRQKGTCNKLTASLKDMILGALDDVGGRDYLAEQGRKNPGVFLTLVGKVLPMSVAGADGTPASPRRVIIELDDARS